MSCEEPEKRDTFSRKKQATDASPNLLKLSDTVIKGTTVTILHEEMENTLVNKDTKAKTGNFS